MRFKITKKMCLYKDCNCNIEIEKSFFIFQIYSPKINPPVRNSFINVIRGTWLGHLMYLLNLLFFCPVDLEKTVYDRRTGEQTHKQIGNRVIL